MKVAGWAIGCLVVLAALAACTEGQPGAVAARSKSDRARLLGAVPPAAAERGVYLFEPAAPEDLLPGSLAGPDLAVVIQGAELVVETAVPPLVLATGVPDEVALPAGVTKVEGVLVAAVDDGDRAEAGDRLRRGEPPEGSLAGLAAASEPVGWAGPAEVASPAAGDLGDVLVLLSARRIHIRAESPDPGRAIQAIARELGTGTVPSSPGKAWTGLLRSQDILLDDRAVIVKAKPTGLPGLLLRQLIDSRSLSFLVSG